MHPSFSFNEGFCEDFSIWNSGIWNRTVCKNSTFKDISYKKIKEFIKNIIVLDGLPLEESLLEPLYAYAKDCNYDPKNCSTEENLCDGIVHCLDGRDEHDCLQKANFPEEATLRCIEDHRGKYNLEILAVPCNGVQECRDGIDEKLCGRSSNIVIIIATLLFLLVLTL